MENFVEFNSLTTSNRSIVLFPTLNIRIRLTTINKSPHVKESKTVSDYNGFHFLDSEFQVLDFGFFVGGLGFQISIVSGLPNSLSCFPNSRIPASTSKHFPHSGFINSDSLSLGKKKLRITNDTSYTLLKLLKILYNWGHIKHCAWDQIIITELRKVS